MSIFEKAARLKLRFDTPRGLLSAEDLWDLPLTSQRNISLNSIAQDAYKTVNTNDVPDFITGSTPASNTEAQLRLDLVKHVIDVRKEENAATTNAAAKREQKQKIMELLEEKQHDELKSKSPEELRAMLEGI